MHWLTYQVQGWIEKDPDHVDIVPVNGGSLDTPMFFGRVMIFAHQVPIDQNQDDTTEDMQGMNAGHNIKDGTVDAVCGPQFPTPFQADDADKEEDAQACSDERGTH